MELPRADTKCTADMSAGEKTPKSPVVDREGRDLLSPSTRAKAKNLHWHEGFVTREERETLMGHKGCCIWLTGLSGSGKSTIAVGVEQVLVQRGIKTYRLDGDNIRFGLNKNIGFSPEDRKENIRRVGEVSKLLCDAGMVVVASFISPYEEDRQTARALFDSGKMMFMETFVKCPLEEAEKRDPKGLYKKARAGEIKEFTGISAPFEEPTNPEITINTDCCNEKEAVEILIEQLQIRKIISPSSSS